MDRRQASNGRFRVALAGGGTGGHLMPGIAVAEELRREIPDAYALFLGTGSPLEEAVLGPRGLACEHVRSPKLVRSAKGVASFCASMPLALARSFRLLRGLRPRALVGLGGFGSFAPAVAARALQIPMLLLEQNVVPGRANRVLSRWASDVACQWTESQSRFPRRARTDFVGNPVRRDVLTGARSVREAFGLDPQKRTLLVMGGSQGARAINELMTAALPELQAASLPLQVIHLAGQHDCEKVRQAYVRVGVPAYVCGFLTDMASAYAAADLAVARAGGTSIAELTAVGVPSILIPYPFAVDNHQYYNAKGLADRGGAVLAVQNELTAKTLADLTLRLLGDPCALDRMRNGSKGLGRPEAARLIVARLQRMAHGRHSRAAQPH